MITAASFGVAELEHLCENDVMLPKERAEYKDAAKMTTVLDALVAEAQIRKAAGGNYEFTPVPAQRFLPKGWTGEEVRRYYYENGSGFGSLRDTMCVKVCNEVKAVIGVYESAEVARAAGNATEATTLQNKADAQWGVLHADEKVSSDHDTYPNTAAWKTEYSTSSNYHADHIEPLAWLWEHAGQNDCPHADRLEKCGGAGKNLRPMWGPDNSGKGATGPGGKTGEYMRKPWVGPSFTGPGTGGMMDAGYNGTFRLSI